MDFCCLGSLKSSSSRYIDIVCGVVNGVGGVDRSENISEETMY